jgi:hypothetical protein
MPSPYPINLLKNELHENEVALIKSTKLYEKNLIDYNTHIMHKTNLSSKIEEYKYAIFILEKNKRK